MDLTATQKKLLTDYQTKLYADKQNKIDAIFREKLKASDGPAKSTALQKIRLIDASTPNADKTAILSIWNANDAHVSLRENTWLDLQYVTTSMRGKDMLLMTTSMSILREIKSANASTVHCASKRKLTAIADIDAYQFKPHFNEFDTLGVVVKVDEIMSEHTQSVFLADAQQNLLCMKFWAGIQHYAYDDVVRVGHMIVVCQLAWRTYSRFNLNGIPQAFVTELTTFSANPKSTDRLYSLNCMREQFGCIDLSEFIDECDTKLGQNNHSNKENSMADNSTNSTFNSTNQSMHNRTNPIISPAPPTNRTNSKRIERLLQYGSPPPLSKSYLKTHKNDRKMVNKPFKNPCQEPTSTKARSK